MMIELAYDFADDDDPRPCKTMWFDDGQPEAAEEPKPGSCEIATSENPAEPA
jgi:hypothetical protein